SGGIPVAPPPAPMLLPPPVEPMDPAEPPRPPLPGRAPVPIMPASGLVEAPPADAPPAPDPASWWPASTPASGGGGMGCEHIELLQTRPDAQSVSSVQVVKQVWPTSSQRYGSQLVGAGITHVAAPLHVGADVWEPVAQNSTPH